MPLAVAHFHAVVDRLGRTRGLELTVDVTVGAVTVTGGLIALIYGLT